MTTVLLIGGGLLMLYGLGIWLAFQGAETVGFDHPEFADDRLPRTVDQQRETAVVVSLYDHRLRTGRVEPYGYYQPGDRLP